jgi:hypothetical protein
MGLQKALVLNTGITLNYWRINAVSVDMEANYTSVRVGGYISKADALAKKAPLKSIEYMFRGSANPIVANMEPNSWTPALYDKVRFATASENDTDLEKVQKLSLLGIPGLLIGATVVSDLPD